MSLKMEFVERAKQGEKIAPLCREFGISRTAGHKWLRRFEAHGYEGLDDVTRRPKTSPLSTAEDVVLAVLGARDAHPRWGPRKLAPILRRKLGEQAPSERTIARILKRADKVRQRRQRRPPNVVERAPAVRAEYANDVWTVDFKGWWRARNGERCEPLTVRDAFSRYVLSIVVCRPTLGDVRNVFEQLFRRYGVPNAIKCDNGTPFVCTRARGGLSTLSAWWMSLGIRIVRSRPGCPQDNGGHERMHADVKGDVQAYPGATAEIEQDRLNKWKQEFNNVRPHDALGGKTPAEVYKVKDRRRPFLATYKYPPEFHVRRVHRSGHFYFRSDVLFVSGALSGLEIGLEHVDDMHVRAWFRDLDLGVIETMPDVSVACFEPTPRSAKRTA